MRRCRPTARERITVGVRREAVQAAGAAGSELSGGYDLHHGASVSVLWPVRGQAPQTVARPFGVSQRFTENDRL